MMEGVQMKRILFSILVLIMIAFTGCDDGITNYKNIDEIIFARVLAIDKANTDSNDVSITAAYQVSTSGGSGDPSAKKKQADVITSEGKTLFDTVRNFNSFSDRKIFLGQVDFILFSEDIAKDGLLKYIDFFARYYEVNLNTDIFIVKNTTAKELLDTAVKNEYFVSKYLKSLLENSRYLSISSGVKLKDIIRSLDKSYISPYLPSLRIKESLNEDGENDIEMDGYAIFDGEKLIGYFTEKEARGFNWITNKVISGVILVKGKDGKDISLEIHSSRTKIRPVFDNNNLAVTVSVDMSSNISEQTSSEDIYNEQTLEYLKNQQEQIIKREIEKALALAKDKHTDVFGIGDIIYHKHPIKWQGLENTWMEAFANLKTDVEVASDIKRTYITKQPTRSENIRNR